MRINFASIPCPTPGPICSFLHNLATIFPTPIHSHLRQIATDGCCLRTVGKAFGLQPAADSVTTSTTCRNGLILILILQRVGKGSGERILPQQPQQQQCTHGNKRQLPQTQKDARVPDSHNTVRVAGPSSKVQLHHSTHVVMRPSSPENNAPLHRPTPYRTCLKKTRQSPLTITPSHH